MDYLLGIVKNIVYFVLLAKIITALVPEGAMKRYIKFFLGIVLMVLLIGPIISLGSMDQDILNGFIRNNSSIDYEELINNSEAYTGLNDSIAIDIYKEQLVAQIKQLLVSEEITIHEINIEIEEDRKNELFGQVNHISIIISLEDEALVEEVVIESIQSENIDIEVDYKGTLIKKRVKNILINFYNLPSDNINIIVEDNE